MTLETLELRNFQCHKHLAIDLDAKVSVLIGRSDIGKSAILRALRWICQNVPAGQEFVRDGSSFCKVTLTVDGQKILRKVGKANEYQLDDKKFKAFGRTVPPDIAKLLNVRDENFQEQLDGPFWLALTPGQVGKELNSIINLGVIDEVLSSLNNETRRASQNVELTKDRLTEAKAKKTELAWVPAMADKLTGLQALQQETDVKQQQGVALSKMLRQASQGQARLKRLRTGQEQGLQAIAAGKQVLAKHESGRLLGELTVELKQRKAELCRLRKEHKQARRRFKKATTGQQCPICGKNLS